MRGYNPESHDLNTNDLEQETYIALKSSIMTLTLRASAWEMR